MKLSNQKILAFAGLKQISSKVLPVKLAYAINVNAAAMEPALEAHETQRMALVERYAKKDKNGKPVVKDGNFAIENIKDWNQAIRELNEAEADITITTVPFCVLEKCDDPKFDHLSLAELSAISFMIEKE